VKGVTGVRAHSTVARASVREVVVSAWRVVDEGAPAGPGPAFEEFQFAPELWMVEQLDPPLREQRLDFEIREALVEVPYGVWVGRRAHFGFPVTNALRAKTFSYPSRRVAVPVDGTDAITLREPRDLVDDALKVDCLAAASVPAAHQVVNHTAFGALTFGMNDREGEGIRAAA